MPIKKISAKALTALKKGSKIAYFEKLSHQYLSGNNLFPSMWTIRNAIIMNSGLEAIVRITSMYAPSPTKIYHITRSGYTINWSVKEIISDSQDGFTLSNDELELYVTGAYPSSQIKVYSRQSLMATSWTYKYAINYSFGSSGFYGPIALSPDELTLCCSFGNRVEESQFVVFKRQSKANTTWVASLGNTGLKVYSLGQDALCTFLNDLEIVCGKAVHRRASTSVSKFSLSYSIDIEPLLLSNNKLALCGHNGNSTLLFAAKVRNDVNSSWVTLTHSCTQKISAVLFATSDLCCFVATTQSSPQKMIVFTRQNTSITKLDYFIMDFINDDVLRPPCICIDNGLGSGQHYVLNTRYAGGGNAGSTVNFAHTSLFADMIAAVGTVKATKTIAVDLGYLISDVAKDAIGNMNSVFTLNQ